MAPPLGIRRATATDAYELWIWANDDVTRERSFGREPIPWSSHVAWVAAALEDEDREVLIAETVAGQPVGSIRFDTEDQWERARLSYVVAPEARGRGYGTSIVEHGSRWLLDHHPAASVWARVMVDNGPSLRIFRKLEWSERLEGGSMYFEAPDTSDGDQRR